MDGSGRKDISSELAKTAMERTAESGSWASGGARGETASRDGGSGGGGFAAGAVRHAIISI